MKTTPLKEHIFFNHDSSRKEFAKKIGVTIQHVRWCINQNAVIDANGQIYIELDDRYKIINNAVYKPVKSGI